MVILFDLSHPALDDLIAPGETHIAQTIIDPSRAVFAVFLDPGFDIFAVGVQLALSATRAWWFKNQSWILDILLNRIAADAQLPCDGPLLSPFRCSAMMSKMVSFSNRSPVQSFEFKFFQLPLNSALFPGGSILNDHFWLTLSRPSTTSLQTSLTAAFLPNWVT